MSLLERVFFWDESAAARVIEVVRWPQGAECPGCSEVRRVRPIGGRTTASGSFKCYGCNRRFSVRNGCMLEGSHIPLSRWLRAILLLACATKPVGCKHLEEVCGVAPRIARTLRHKIADRLAAGYDASGAVNVQTALGAVSAAVATPVSGDRVFEDVCRGRGVPDNGEELVFLRAVCLVLDGDFQRRPSPPVIGSDPEFLAAGHVSDPLGAAEMPFYCD